LATPDTANELQFEPGRAIPVAFFAWDGSSGEHGTRLAVSTWYFLALDQPTPPRVFISPVVAMALTLGLGVMVVLRAQRRGTAGSRGGGGWGVGWVGWGFSYRRSDAQARFHSSGCSRCGGRGTRGVNAPTPSGRRDDRRQHQVHRGQAGEPEDRHD